MTTKDLVALQRETGDVRNICILAHVDHGKTSLSDTLLATNGIISERLSGAVWFLDYLEEEQRRRITMKSSVISLLHRGRNLVNLVDSPGHVDFSGEVSGAVRVTDGALLLVDVIEGVCIQTRLVVQQAWRERLRLCLVFTKMDKLIQNAQMTPAEAYDHLCKLIEQVNAIMSALQHEDKLAREHEQADKKQEEDEEEEAYFSPEKGNVAFSSSTHRWGFRPSLLARMYAARLHMNEAALQKVLWGQYYLDVRHQRVLRRPPTPQHAPVFVQLVLKPIWDVYHAVYSRDDARLAQIARTLQIADFAGQKDLASSDRGLAVAAVMSRWLPIGGAVLDMVVQQLPSPRDAQRARLPALFGRPLALPPAAHAVEDAVARCDADDSAPVLAFVIKMFSVSAKEYAAALPRADAAAATASAVAAGEGSGDDDGAQLIAVARVFSGVLRPGARMYVLGPRHVPTAEDSDSEETSEDCTPVVLDRVFLLMGQSLESVDCVPAGNICGISGLGGAVLKTATLASTRTCRPLAPLWSLNNRPIVRVAVEPRNPDDMGRLVAGLRMLNRADPMCQTLTQESGEHVVVASGELHLERCIHDLREVYAKVDLNVSEPIVPLRETVVAPTSTAASASSSSSSAAAATAALSAAPCCEKRTPNQRVCIRVLALPLPAPVVALLERHQATIADAVAETADVPELGRLHAELDAALAEAGPRWKALAPRVWAFGPHHVGPNMLFNGVPDSALDPAWRSFFARFGGSSTADSSSSTVEEDEETMRLADLDSSVVTGFQMATASGPLCGEPMRGVAFVVRALELAAPQQQQQQQQQQQSPEAPEADAPNEEEYDEDWGALLDAASGGSGDGGDSAAAAAAGASDGLVSTSGQMISTTAEACRGAFALCPQRLEEPMYRCEVQVSQPMLGKMYSVLHRRRARILNEDVREGTSTFVITAQLPVIESFGFAEEILTKTSGEAIPQLVFDCFELLDVDPFFVPTTKEELAEFGDGSGGMAPNIALNYIQATRRRKVCCPSLVARFAVIFLSLVFICPFFLYTGSCDDGEACGARRQAAHTKQKEVSAHQHSLLSFSLFQLPFSSREKPTRSKLEHAVGVALLHFLEPRRELAGAARARPADVAAHGRRDLVLVRDRRLERGEERGGTLAPRGLEVGRLLLQVVERGDGARDGRGVAAVGALCLERGAAVDHLAHERERVAVHGDDEAARGARARRGAGGVKARLAAREERVEAVLERSDLGRGGTTGGRERAAAQEARGVGAALRDVRAALCEGGAVAVLVARAVRGGLAARVCLEETQALRVVARERGAGAGRREAEREDAVELRREPRKERVVPRGGERAEQRGVVCVARGQRLRREEVAHERAREQRVPEPERVDVERQRRKARLEERRVAPRAEPVRLGRQRRELARQEHAPQCCVERCKVRIAPPHTVRRRCCALDHIPLGSDSKCERLGLLLLSCCRVR